MLHLLRRAAGARLHADLEQGQLGELEAQLRLHPAAPQVELEAHVPPIARNWLTSSPLVTGRIAVKFTWPPAKVNTVVGQIAAR